MFRSNPCTHVSDGAPSNFPVVTSHHFTRHANQWMMHVQASYCYRNHPPMSIPTHTQLLYVVCMFCIFQYYPPTALCMCVCFVHSNNCSMYVCMFCILQYYPPTALCMCVCFVYCSMYVYNVLYTPILPPNCSMCMCVCFVYSNNCSMYVCMF